MRRSLTLAVLVVTGVISACDGTVDPTEPTIPDPRSPTIPELIAPAQGAILDNGCLGQRDAIIWEFDWSDVERATGYHLFVKGQNAVYPVIDEVVGASRFRHESLGYIIARHQRGWRWRVRARIGESWMDWTEERTFDVEPLNSDCP